MNVASVEELKSAVSPLSVENLSRFSEWFEEFMADPWDQKIEADILAGRLSAAGKRADDDFEHRRIRTTYLPPTMRLDSQHGEIDSNNVSLPEPNEI
jgi:hypothetical protein